MKIDQKYRLLKHNGNLVDRNNGKIYSLTKMKKSAKTDFAILVHKEAMKRSPFILGVVDVMRSTKRANVITEHVAHTLREKLKSKSELKDPSIIKYRIKKALEALHSMNVVHTNVSPDTIVFDSNDEAYLSGFEHVAMIGSKPERMLNGNYRYDTQIDIKALEEISISLTPQ